MKVRVSIVRSTTALTTVEFIVYMASVARQCSELGIILPEPSA